ncbi:MAG TPA: hypothetical protein VJ975_06420 [Candidatus Limnocylindria bacterium]|nr:hypothetical protein [Candidatus Limnocylindria bacterium]
MDVPVDDGDQAEAASRMVLGLTFAAGAMVALTGAVAGSGSVIVGVPTAALLLFLLVGATRAAGWCGVAIWVFLAPMAAYDGILAPLVMIAGCAVIALDPSRVYAWFTDGPRPASTAADLEPAWIEEL